MENILNLLTCNMTDFQVWKADKISDFRVWWAVNVIIRLKDLIS